MPVRLPQVHLSGLLLGVLVIALEFAAMRALWRAETVMTRMVLMGSMPMANVLAMATLVARSRRRDRDFLVGFVASGMLAMAVFFAWGWASPESLESRWGGWSLSIWWHLGLDGRGWQFAVLVVISSAVWVMPQLVFALAGGLLLALGSRIIRPESIAPGVSSHR